MIREMVSYEGCTEGPCRRRVAGLALTELKGKEQH